MTKSVKILGYADRLSARPGDSVGFKVSCLGTDEYRAEIVRLLSPEVGPGNSPQLAPPFGIAGIRGPQPPTIDS